MAPLSCAACLSSKRGIQTLLVAFHSFIPAVLLITASAARDDGFDVRVELRANWPEVPSTGLELEWAKRLGPSHAKRVLKSIVDGDGSVGITMVPDILGSSLLLANRLHSPAVEAQRAASRSLEGSARCKGGAFAAIGGEVVCSVAELSDALGATDARRAVGRNSSGAELIGLPLTMDTLILDEAFGGPMAMSIVLCGCLEDASLKPFLQWALSRAEHGFHGVGMPLRVAYRQADCPQVSAVEIPREVLSGYAVELRIKSSEYKATDDAKDAPPTPATNADGNEPSAADDDDDDADDAGVKAAEVLDGVEVAGLKLAVLARRFPGISTNLVALREALESEGGTADEVLHRWELDDLGLKLAQRIVRSPDQLRTLASITDNFPAMMAGIARTTKVKSKMRKALGRLRGEFEVSEHQTNIMELNNHQLKEETLTLFPILERLESSIVDVARLSSGTGAAMTRAELAYLQRQNLSAGVHHPSRLDWRAKELKWCYHVKTDEEAEDWPQRLSALASEKDQDAGQEDMFGGLDMFGGMGRMPKARKPLQVQQPVFTVVLVFDPLEAGWLDIAENLTGGPRPARVALVPVPQTASENLFTDAANTSRAVADAFAWLLKAGARGDAAAARGFLKALKGKMAANRSDVESLLQKHLPKARRGAASAWPKVTAAGASAAFEAYVRSKGLPVPSLVVNGRVATGEASVVKSGLSDLFVAEEDVLRAAVRSKKLRDGKKIKEGDVALEQFLLQHSTLVAPSFDASLTPALKVAAATPQPRGRSKMGIEAARERFRERRGGQDADGGDGGGGSSDAAAVVLQELDVESLPTFGPGKGAPVNASITLFLRREEDVQLLQAFADVLASTSGSSLRLSVASGPLLGSYVACASTLHRCLAVASQEAGSLTEQAEGLRRAAACCQQGGDGPSCCNSEPAEADKARNAVVAAEQRLWLAVVHALQRRGGTGGTASSSVGAVSGDAVAVCNGLVVPSVPASSNSPALLLRHWCPSPIAGVPLHATALAGAVASPPSAASMRKCVSGVPRSLRLHLAPRDPESPVLASLAGIVDPLHEDAGSFAHLAEMAHAELNAEICIALNPKQLQEYPLKRWQRRVVGTAAAGAEGYGRMAVFPGLRTRHTLTLFIKSPASWLVTALDSEHDLDNIRAADATAPRRLEHSATSSATAATARPEVFASFVLSRLYLEGSAHVQGSGNAATGLQLELMPAGGGLGTSCSGADTRVMQNGGFWSMPACPGPYELSLVPGASNDTFALTDGASPATLLEVSSFLMPFRHLSVQVRQGHKETDLKRKTLGVRPSRARRKAALAATAGGLPTVHIFTLASGHLYERLLAIMVHSVRNHTRCPLHFWIISQFLSPGFTDALPRLQASLEGVTFDLVSFKWPSWLNPQQEKQRVIWAYKILFLDVLFPMDVPRVIFIDSDLVVRADVRELWEMDMKGRAYAFTPFCSGEVAAPDGSGINVSRRNNATTGYRFWESGYWKNHLGTNGYVYHISALFVVDLLEFRRENVGDSLRAEYNGLTMNEGSLANLDQDLPNYAQHTIPIFSLPQEWLWCETWCSLETKPLAKAIDLCQNPNTKESKTTMAKRVIEEWDSYNARVEALRSATASNATAPVTARELGGGRVEL